MVKKIKTGFKKIQELVCSTNKGKAYMFSTDYTSKIYENTRTSIPQVSPRVMTLSSSFYVRELFLRLREMTNTASLPERITSLDNPEHLLKRALYLLGIGEEEPRQWIDTIRPLISCFPDAVFSLERFPWLAELHPATLQTQEGQKAWKTISKLIKTVEKQTKTRLTLEVDQSLHSFIKKLLFTAIVVLERKELYQLNASLKTLERISLNSEGFRSIIIDFETFLHHLHLYADYPTKDRHAVIQELFHEYFFADSFSLDLQEFLSSPRVLAIVLEQLGYKEHNAKRNLKEFLLLYLFDPSEGLHLIWNQLQGMLIHLSDISAHFGKETSPVDPGLLEFYMYREIFACSFPSSQKRTMEKSFLENSIQFEHGTSSTAYFFEQEGVPTRLLLTIGKTSLGKDLGNLKRIYTVLDEACAKKVVHAFPSSNHREQKFFLAEVEHYKHLKKQRVLGILKPLEMQQDALILPYLPYKLNDLVEGPFNSQIPKFSAEFVSKIVLDLAEKLSAFHESGLVHFDIKLDNILLDRQFEVFLIDFGLSMKIGTPLRGSRGTTGFKDPFLDQWFAVKRIDWSLRDDRNFERQEELLADPKFDVYSFGIVLWTILDSWERQEQAITSHPLYNALQEIQIQCSSSFLEQGSKMKTRKTMKQIAQELRELQADVKGPYQRSEEEK